MDSDAAADRVVQLMKQGHRLRLEPDGRDYQGEFHQVLDMLYRRATLADRWRAKRRSCHWMNSLNRCDDSTDYRRDFYAVLSMLERRATWLDRLQAAYRPRHWLNSARRELLIVGKR